MHPYIIWQRDKGHTVEYQQSYMMSVLFLAIKVLLVSLGICYSSEALPVEVFYVKPTGPTTECPSGDSPCHSLQYYANHSNFTNNSRFLFLEGEHHLDSVVNITNVANLSLVGASESGVKVLCKSVPSGFHIEEFNKLRIENMAMTNCNGLGGASISLTTGSEVSLHHVDVVISNSSALNAYGLVAFDVVGSFLIFNSSFFASRNGNITIQYSFCDRPSYFNFSSSKFITLLGQGSTGLSIEIDCSDVQIQISYSVFEYTKLKVDDTEMTNNSVLIANSLFREASMTFWICSWSCDVNPHCRNNYITLSGVTTINCSVVFQRLSHPTNDCAIFIEDSIFDGPRDVSFYQLATKIDLDDEPIQVVLHNVTFANYHLKRYSATYSANTVILFVKCTFENNTGSAIKASGSKVIFQGSTIFRNNSALIGGGMQLTASSYMVLRPHTHILFEGNRAYYVGGAIYSDSDSNNTRQCFFQVDYPAKNSTIRLMNNFARVAGSSLYSRTLLGCPIEILDPSVNSETYPSALASDPVNVCLCGDSELYPSDCSNRIRNTYAFPGEDFQIRLAVVGDLVGVVPGAIRAYVDYSDNFTIGLSQISQASDRPYCKNFYYSVNTAEKKFNVSFGLTAEQTFFKAITGDSDTHLLVAVFLKDCPLGFSLSNVTGKCACDPVITRDNIECFINDQSILRPANSWIGFINEINKTGVMFHPNCPIGCCLPHDVNITVNTRDSQCEPHRTGLLCGECEDGYSLSLGNLKCAKCSNTYLLLILPFAVIGLLLVVTIFAFNLTVTEGGINGLIFYANVIGMHYSVLLPEEKGYLDTFLAWLNLDLGITTCLYDGMDGYAEIWLQFVFPAYLWVIILLVIQFYRKFPALANRLGGENAVKVLATILLLSYTKLQRTVVNILSFTWLEYPDGVVRYVWLMDANVEFFKGKHLYLGIAGILVLVFLIVPYTLCLAFFQQLQACSGHRLFQWVNKLKPVFDSYAGPYKDKYRYWAGMLLLVRTLLIILFTINTAGSPDFNLLIILVVSLTLLMAHSNGVYKKWPYNYVESFFYLQLGVFAAGIVYARHNYGSITAVADTSFGLTLIVSFAVLGYHIFYRSMSLKGYYYRLKGYADIVGEEPSVNHERE